LGFVGSHLIPKLAEVHSVVAFDHGTPAYGTGLTPLRKSVVRPHAAICETDILNLDPGHLGQLFASGLPDLIIHLAAWPGVRSSLEQQDAYFRNNVLASQQVLAFARDYKVPTIMTSSSSVYGDRGQYESCREEDANGYGLRSPYAVSKWITECWYEAIASTLPPVLFVRPFTLYGPLGRPDMAYFSFAQRLLQGLPIRVFGDLDTQRDFTYINDAVYYLSSLVEAMLSDPGDVVTQFKLDGGRSVVNICNGQPEQLTSLVELLASELDVDPKVEFLPRSELDLRGTFGDPRNLHSLITPQQTQFADGIHEFCTWLRTLPA